MAEICQSRRWIWNASEWTMCSCSNLQVKWKGDNRNCSCNRAVKRLEHGMKVVERVL